MWITIIALIKVLPPSTKDPGETARAGEETEARHKSSGNIFNPDGEERRKGQGAGVGSVVEEKKSQPPYILQLRPRSPLRYFLGNILQLRLKHCIGVLS